MGVQVLREFATRMSSMGCSMYDILQELDNMSRDPVIGIHEEKDIKAITNHLKLEVLDINKFIKVNDLPKVTNYSFFDKPGQPSEDGLLSYTIFGITSDDRRNRFAYIDLNKKFLHPLIYKAWVKVNSKIKNVIAKLDTYSIDKDGYIVQDPEGSNGIEFLIKNINKIKFEETGKIKKDISVRFLQLNRKKNLMFIDKEIIIPAFYRDVNTNSSTKGSVGVGKINQLYQSLLIQANSINSTQEYGFDMSGPSDMRMQETLVTIYDWFCGVSNSSIGADEKGIGIHGKFGIYRMANMSKTSDFASRLVISAPQLKANSPKDMITSFDKSSVPLASVISCFAPFVQFAVRQFFMQEFMGTEMYPVFSPNNKETVQYKKIVDPGIQFSDDVILQQMNHFIHGYNNRFIPVEIQFEDGTKYEMQFKGYYHGDEGLGAESIHKRRLTWVDVLYMGCVEAVKNKMALISRYPVDSRTNQFATEIEVASTNETEPMYVGDTFYKNYPKIKDSDIGKDSSNMFIDTLSFSNLYLAGIGGDYDGDQCSIRGVFTDEANQELRKFVKSKKNFIEVGASNIRVVDSDTVQSLYSITKILPEDANKLSDPKF